MHELLDTFFNTDVFLSSLPLLLKGLVNTIILGITVIVVGTIAGLFTVLLRLYAWSPVRFLAVLYIDVMRSLPSLVLLVVIYFALPFVSITLSPFLATTLALSMVGAAYTAEICRAGIEAIPKGQFEAASALGLSFLVVLRKVILPQALRLVIPPLVSNAISALKETSIASVVATPDLLKMALDTQAQNANPTPLMGAALIYVIVLWPLVKFGARVEGVRKHTSNR